jgi:PAS domain-containing protein
MYGTAIDTDQLAGLCGVGLDALSRPVLICDRETILFANVAAARFLRAGSADELIGLRLDDVVHPDMHTPGAIRRTLLTESRQQLLGLPAKVYARDGSIITALTDARPIEFEGHVAVVYSCARPDSDHRS